MMATTADSAVSEEHAILDRLAVKGQKILACGKVAICYLTEEGTLVVGGTAGCQVLRTGDILGAFEASRPPDAADGHTELWDGRVTICGEPLNNPAVLKIKLKVGGELGYLISGDRHEAPSAEDVTIGLTTAQQIASVIIEHFRPNLRRC